MESDEKLPYSVMMGAVSYMDMILAALIRHPCMRDVLEERGFAYTGHQLPYTDVPIGIELYCEAEGCQKAERAGAAAGQGDDIGA